MHKICIDIVRCVLSPLAERSKARFCGRRLLGLRVRIPPEAWMSCLLSVLSTVVVPTVDVSLCVIEKPQE